MGTKRLLIFCLLLTVISCKSGFNKNEDWRQKPLTPGSPEDYGFSGERLDSIDALFNNFMEKDRINGAIALIARKGKIIYFRANGFKDLSKKEALQKDGIFRVASQTKAITSVAVMMLWERGLLDIDSAVSNYLPEFKNPVVIDSFNQSDSSYTTRPARREVSIRDLLSHTSGYCYQGSGGEAINALYARNAIMGGVPEKSTSLKYEMGKLSAMPLLAQPGERFCYGLSTDILGYLVEEISGMSLEDFFRENIFEPLGMKDSYFSLPEDRHERLMNLYMDSEQGLVKAGASLMNYPKRTDMYNSGGGGLSSTAMDYAVFLQMLLNGGQYNGKRILEPETIQQMRTNQIGKLESGSLFLPASGDKFGLGFEIIQKKEKDVSPIPDGSYGWGGAFGSLYWVDRENEMVVHLVLQKVANYSDVRYDFIEAVYDAML